ncbi:DNA/RNA non-specific endonuclease [Borrelia miyamotoi]|uniref:Endonuclease n=1 Tax=Borrelia miyamotoi TaxID=47466 RepID=A0AAX3JN38_9SPIR|nr:DNA/RNA non-specific endonuclease [Borrelia miyamotoi]QFP41930.1 DNA/RNA non-specific endonuclease [Borrelia miyamotoi]QFP48049.1 DNA/RNA non-specific endonuclease [Borrelia miyamotoi]QGT55807.1 DNA/RNA non-specific endonuclease [Borrelia miyamotoi]QGT56586.1 DNA/RNA non-specific endonuclease [Borrelia miyamotoi]WAZ71840.1 DNA/RNA non-specific endonuclease [Borrelia miyamotoi]
MKKKIKILFCFYILILLVFLFLYQNPKTLNNIKKIASSYLEKLKEQIYEPKSSIELKEEHLLPKGYLTTQILNKKYYSLGYAESARQAEWTAYHLKREMIELALTLIKENKIKRSKKFFEDKDIKGIAPKLTDYIKSGYDRGHIVSSADMSFSKNAMIDTYFLSNISPQQKEFNSGIWLKLEKLVRKWAILKEKIYIISAGILTENKGFIGKNKILIPKNFYKIILSLNNDNSYDILAFIIPNKKAKDLELRNYVVNVNTIEEKTKIDFFAKLDAGIKKIIKMKKDIHSWKF